MLTVVVGYVYAVLWPRRPCSVHVPQQRVFIRCRAKCVNAISIGVMMPCMEHKTLQHSVGALIANCRGLVFPGRSTIEELAEVARYSSILPRVDFNCI